MLESISYEQLLRWSEFYAIEPFGPDRSDFMIAQLSALTFNINRGKNARPAKPKDFMPEFGPRQEQTPEQMKAIFKAFAAAHNGAINGRSR